MMTTWKGLGRGLVLLALVLAGCGEGDGPGGGAGADGGSDAAGGGSTSGEGACGDYGFGCMYGGFCHDTPSGKQDVCEEQNGTWLGGNCPRDGVVGCCISPVPGTSGTLIDYYYSPVNTTESVQQACGTNEFHGP
jgi:hypothetical protein